MFRRRNKHAWVITGAASGFGREFARRLAALEHRLVLWDLDEAGLVQVATELGDCVLHTETVDVTQSESVLAAAQRSRAVATLGHVIHCAGILRVGAVGVSPPSDFQAMMDVNYMGSVNVVTALLNDLKQAGDPKSRSTLAIIASVSGLRGFPLMSGYCASKFALIGFGQALDEELHGTPVDLRMICPPPGDTPMVQALEELPAVYTLSRLFTAEEIVSMSLRRLERSGWLMLLDANSKAMRWADRLAPWLVNAVIGRATRR